MKVVDNKQLYCTKGGEKIIFTLLFFGFAMKRRWVFGYFLVGCVLLGCYLCKGYVDEKGAGGKRSVFRSSFVESKHHYSILVIGEANSSFFPGQLSSILAQEDAVFRLIYIDAGLRNTDRESLSKWVSIHQEEHDIHLVRLSEKQSAIKCAYELIHEMDDQEIVLFLHSGDFLIHPHVLSHMRGLYADPNIWAVSSCSLYHPNYQEIRGKQEGDMLSARHLLDKEVSLFSFYASLFKAVSLEDLFSQGSWISDHSGDIFSIPMIEMSGDHLFCSDEIMLIKGCSLSMGVSSSLLQETNRVRREIALLPSYSPLLSLPVHSSAIEEMEPVDVLIVSQNRPLHLLALLESIEKYVSGIKTVYVVYASSNADQERGYLYLQTQFPCIEFLSVCDYPGHHFGELVRKVVSHCSRSSHLFLSSDSFLFRHLDFREAVYFLGMTQVGSFIFHQDEREKDFSFFDDRVLYRSQEILPLYSTLSHRGIIERLMKEKWDDLPGLERAWGNLYSQSVLCFPDKREFLLEFDNRSDSSLEGDWARILLTGGSININALYQRVDSQSEMGSLPIVGISEYPK